MKGERRIQRLVESISYKPGATFVVRLSKDRKSMNLRIAIPVVNSDPPYAPYEVDGNWKIDPEWIGKQSDDSILASFMVCAAQLELHEVNEHFKVNGVRLRDPHPDGKATGKFSAVLSDAFYQEIMRASE